MALAENGPYTRSPAEICRYRSILVFLGWREDIGQATEADRYVLQQIMSTPPGLS